MPQTSSVTLLPPPAVLSTSNTSYSPATDSSFQQSLESAQQRQSTGPDDPNQANATHQFQKSQKKTGKRAKPKAVNAADPGKIKSDDSSTSDDAPASPEAIESDVTPSVPDKSTNEKEKASLPASPTLPATSVAPAPAHPVSVRAVTKASAGVQDNANKPLDGKPAVVKLPNPNQNNAKPDHDDKGTGSATATDPAGDAQPAPAVAAVASPTDSVGPTTVKSAGFCTATPNSADTDAPVEAKTKETSAQTSGAQSDAQLPQELSDVVTSQIESVGSPHDSSAAESPALSSNFEQQLQRALAPLSPKDPPPAPATPQAQFADANHPSIVTAVQSELLPNGGTMQLRLDPPDLGALQVTVHMRDGVMTAAFETSNDQATRMLSHSLSQLKTSLELSGLSVEKMHVQQSPRQESRGSSGDSQQQAQDPQQQQAKQDQQRRQMLQRMWNKLAGVDDPLDLVA